MSEQADAGQPPSSNGPAQTVAQQEQGDDHKSQSTTQSLPLRADMNGTPNKSASQPKSTDTDNENGGPPKKKRRKVNHACVYCRRSHMTCDLERPCARCIKRDIGHLCHDEPREPPKRAKSEPELASADTKPTETDPQAVEQLNPYGQNDGPLNIGPPKSAGGSMGAPQILQPKPLSPSQLQKQPNNSQSMPFGDWNIGGSNQFQEMHNLHPNYSFNTSEITNEYNILGDFLSSSLMDDGALYNEDAQALFNDPLLSAASLTTYANPNNMTLMPGQGASQSMAPPQSIAGGEISRPSSTFPIDTKAQDKFYMTAADPAGNDTPEERMNKLLKAKYDAGMLKPFNYVKGYARLNKYMELNMRPGSRQKILRQLEKFRPKFREKMQSLTDMQLVFVEMWFERTLMEYDRVFASMAIPACCWRRTGEIYRGNKEMAELIHVPIEELRDVSHGCWFSRFFHPNL